MPTTPQDRIREALQTQATIDPAEEVVIRVKFLQDYVIHSHRSTDKEQVDLNRYVF